MSDNSILKIAFIRKMPNGKYKVVSRKGKTLGIYNTREQAEKRLQQIEMFKHMKKKAEKEVVDLTKMDDFSFSAAMRKLRAQLSQDELFQFLKLYKEYYDKATKENLQKAEIIALNKALIQFNKIKKVKIDKEMVKEAAVSELGDANQVGQYLANIIRFILQRISVDKRPDSIYKLKQKLYTLNETEIASKNMPASSAMGQAITLVKHILFNHDSRYVREVINNIIRYL